METCPICYNALAPLGENIWVCNTNTYYRIIGDMIQLIGHDMHHEHEKELQTQAAKSGTL